MKINKKKFKYLKRQKQKNARIILLKIFKLIYKILLEKMYNLFEIRNYFFLIKKIIINRN